MGTTRHAKMFRHLSFLNGIPMDLCHIPSISLLLFFYFFTGLAGIILPHWFSDLNSKLTQFKGKFKAGENVYQRDTTVSYKITCSPIGIDLL